MNEIKEDQVLDYQASNQLDRRRLTVRLRLITLCLATSMFFLACVSSAPAKYAVVNLHSQPSLVSVRESAEIAIIKVESEFGIGKAEVAIENGYWPAGSKVRLYLNGLEGFSIVTTKKEFKKNELSVKRVEADGKSYFDVDLPQEIVNSNRSFEIHWVDFYR